MNSFEGKRIGLSLGMLDSLTDGLGEFSTQLCTRIAQRAPAWHEQGVQVLIQLPRRWHGRFGDDVKYLDIHKLQGYWHWQSGRRFDVWHALNQLGRYRPPSFTRSPILTIHDLNPIYETPGDTANKALGKLRHRLRRFDLVTTLTHHVAADIRKHLGWRGPVEVIPNGARDLTDYPRESVPDLAPNGYLLHLSRMAPSKNPECLLELASVWPEQHMVLAGPRNSDSENLRNRALERGLKNLRVIYDVSDSQKAWLYANCRAFLFPSITEGFGLPPVEAMHFGKPVFLSRLTSLPEIGGPWVGYFDRFTPEDMRAEIEREWPRLSAAGAHIRAHAQAFNWDRCASDYIELYRRVLGMPSL